MNVSRIVGKAVSALALSKADMESAVEFVGNAGISGPLEAAQRLHREWLNDMVGQVGRPAYNTAAKNPAKAFHLWLEQRVEHPFHVSYRIIDSVRAQFGAELALIFTELRWHQEIAWARRMRGDDNDRIVLLAELWLSAAKRDPGKLFVGLVETYATSAALDFTYTMAVEHDMGEDEILDGERISECWRPLWLRFAEREFGKIANTMPRPKLTAIAQKARQSELQERFARTRAKQVEQLSSRRPSLMVSVLSEAIVHGLSSDDVVAGENDFIEKIRSGEVDIVAEGEAPWRVFMRTLPRWAETSPPPTAEEKSQRIAAIEALDPSWPDRLPNDFRLIGANDRSVLMTWFDMIAREKRRDPPVDPAVDYGLWLLEQKMS